MRRRARSQLVLSFSKEKPFPFQPVRNRVRNRIESPFERKSKGRGRMKDPLQGSFFSTGRTFSVVQVRTAVPDGGEDAALGHQYQRRHDARSTNDRSELHGCNSMHEETLSLAIRSTVEWRGHPRPSQTIHPGQWKRDHGGKMINRFRDGTWSMDSNTNQGK